MVATVRNAAKRVAELVAAASALVWRAFLRRPTVVAITGSVGKTTAKDCLTAILSAQGTTVGTIGNNNGRGGIPQTVLRARPWHRFVIVEIGIDRPGYMIRSALVVRPDVAVVLRVAAVHSREFGTLEKTASEKAKIFRFLGRSGVAVLNGDDPRVAAMAARLRCRVVRFGSAPEHDVRLEQATSAWPSRLELRVSSGDRSWLVKTRLLGTHWATSVLGALAAAHACGVSLDDAGKALEHVEPFTGRMQPIELPGGVTIVRDDFSAAALTVDAAFDFLRSAKAGRRILVMSDCSDFGANYRHRHRYIAERAAECADAAIFIGEKSDFTARNAIRFGMVPESVCSFLSLREAAEYLKPQLRPGDLVLLKGRVSDHLARFSYALRGEVACSRQTCSKRMLCDRCPELGFRPICIAPASQAVGRP